MNNNAAAVLLVLSALTKGGQVVVSRGELVEIGGSFRIPEIMESCGAQLKEVGATNKTHLRDYENAITENTKALMKVHTSNYRIIGFSETCDVDEAKIREVRAPLEDYPAVLPELLTLVQQMAEDAHCPLAETLRLMMPAESPFVIAILKKAELTISRSGRPKEILLTPSTVFSPISRLT